MPFKPRRSSEQAVSDAQAPAKPVFRLRTRVMVGDEIAIGPGKIALLEAIGSTGSITAAAQSLGMSYRRAWMLLDQVNRALQVPAVDSAKGGASGGGSALTASGEQLIELYRRIEATAAQACKADIQQMLKMLAG